MKKLVSIGVLMIVFGTAKLAITLIWKLFNKNLLNYNPKNLQHQN